MYNILFYEDLHGESSLKTYIRTLRKRAKTDKSARIEFNKIVAYISMLQEQGLSLGMPYIKHLQGPLWELRPIDNRIFFAAYSTEGFVLLHAFRKSTRKTPPREIEQALKEYTEFTSAKGSL